MIGGSTLGNSLMPKKVIPIPPSKRMMREKTVANTGRLMLVEERLIGWCANFRYLL